MKHFYLIINREKEGVLETANQICTYLTDRSATCQICEVIKGQGYGYTDGEKVPEYIDCVITLGGDGTLIQAARDLASKEIPMVGINMGTLGYLTQVSKEEEMEPFLDLLLKDCYHLERRMMLKGVTYHQGTFQYVDLALNEIVITRKNLLKVLKFKIFVNEEFLSEWVADGIIVATPTGSTAYNLSAGGPIVVPDAKMIILTPICPHTLNSRSIVLSGEDKIKIEITGPDPREQVAVFDGDTAVELSQGDYIEIECSRIETVLAKVKSISFLQNLRDKMSAV